MNEDSKLSKLQKGLYSRSAPDIAHHKAGALSKEAQDVPTDWVHPEERLTEQPIEYTDDRMSFFTKFFIGSLVFFILASGIGLFLLFKGANIVSAENIDISVTGPLSVGAGEEFPFDIQVYNKNNITLEVVDMTIEFPGGTVHPDTGIEYPRFQEILPNIEPGSFAQKTVRTILYGEENSKKTIMIKVDYRIKGSNARYYKEKPYEVLISAAPVSLAVNSYKEIQSNQEMEFNIQVSSNSNQVLKGMLLKVYYPFGFTFTSSDVKPLGDNGTWKLGDLKPQEKKIIKIRGRIEGQDDEERVFRFATGLQSLKDERTIATEFVSSSQSVRIRKPFLSTKLILQGNSDTSDYISQYDAIVPVEVQWYNNLPVAVTDAEIRVKFSGIVFDKNSVEPGEGLFKSADNEIIWNTQTTPELRSIAPGETGNVTFSFTPRSKGSATNPTMSINVDVKARRIAEQNVPESLTSSAVRTVRIASSAGLSAQIVRSTGPFENTGPIPPRAEQQTTYTVVWTIANTSSAISNAEVKAVLPPYVKWVSKVSPTGEDIMYNQKNGEVTWKAGDIPAYTGFGNVRREVAFQISFEPSVNQVGRSLVDLVGETSFSAVDIFTGAKLESTRRELTTRFSNDPQFKGGDEIIAP